MPRYDPYDLKHLKNVEAYLKELDRLYTTAIGRLAQLGSKVTLEGNALFKFDMFPMYKKEFDKVFTELADKMEVSILNSINSEWQYGDKKAIDQAMSKLKEKVSRKAFEKMSKANYGSTEKALKTFLKRKTKGMNLSDRVWNFTKQYKGEAELALQLGIQSGKSAHEMALEMQKYLKRPDDLFHRVRDEFGELHLSANAKKYSPGNGVYRSSYKNAMRLTRTETNMAYRGAENQRYKTLPFIVGFEVRLSNRHPAVDICDDLKGKYPKEFNYLGWHPQCLCPAIPIFASDEEFNALEEQILSGQSISTINSQNTVKTPPNGFVEWVERNKEISKSWESQPYFIRDNFKEGTLAGELYH